MVYKVLARKWRPQIFDNVVGQSHVLSAIKNSFFLNRIHHAYIFFGTRGIGKTTIARLFAKTLHCQTKEKSIPCGYCSICLEIENGCFLDVVEIDAASRTKIEDTREFLDDIHYVPNIGKFKIYLIDEVHMLSRNSLNALLKILEEPPQHVKFFLITTEQKKLPSTVLSRCVQFYLRPLSDLQIFNQLLYIFKQEGINADHSSVKLLASFAKGSMRDALSLSEQAIILGKNKISCDIIREMLGIVDVEHALFLLERLFCSDINSVMSRIDQCSKLNVDWDYLLLDMLSFLQKIAVIQLSFSQNENDIHDKITSKQFRLNSLAKKITPSEIQLYYQILLFGRKELFYAPSDRMGFEMIMMRASILLSHLKNKNVNFHSVSNRNVEINTYISNVITNQGTFNPFFHLEKNDSK